MLHIGSVAISVVALQEFVLKRPGSDPKRYVAADTYTSTARPSRYALFPRAFLWSASAPPQSWVLLARGPGHLLGYRLYHSNLQSHRRGAAESASLPRPRASRRHLVGLQPPGRLQPSSNRTRPLLRLARPQPKLRKHGCLRQHRSHSYRPRPACYPLCPRSDSELVRCRGHSGFSRSHLSSGRGTAGQGRRGADQLCALAFDIRRLRIPGRRVRATRRPQCADRGSSAPGVSHAEQRHHQTARPLLAGLV